MKYIRKIIDDYCVLDLETTGFSPNYDSIIEIGIIKVRGNEIVDKYNSLIDPGFLVDDYITSITGITNEMLKGKPKIIDLKDIPLVGNHNNQNVMASIICAKIAGVPRKKSLKR